MVTLFQSWLGKVNEVFKTRKKTELESRLIKSKFKVNLLKKLVKLFAELKLYFKFAPAKWPMV